MFHAEFKKTLAVDEGYRSHSWKKRPFLGSLRKPSQGYDSSANCIVVAESATQLINDRTCYCPFHPLYLHDFSNLCDAKLNARYNINAFIAANLCDSDIFIIHCIKEILDAMLELSGLKAHEAGSECLELLLVVGTSRLCNHCPL